MSRVVKASHIIAILIAASVAAPHEITAGVLAVESRSQLTPERTPPFERVGVVDFPKRYTFDSYAKLKGVPTATIVRRYAATIVIRCGDHQASAQITGAPDIITTSAHVFFNRDTCQEKRTADTCEITVRAPSAQTKYKGFEMVDHGYRKSLSAAGSCPADGLPWGDDWAVLRLRNKKAISAIAKEIKPYKLPGPGPLQKLDERVVAVSGAALDFFDFTPDGTKFYPRNIQDCTVRNVETAGDGYVETDCDSAELSSGGALLRPDRQDDTLIGLHMGSYETKSELTKALAENRTNTHPYKRGYWTGLYVSVDRDFLHALQRAIQPD